MVICLEAALSVEKWLVEIDDWLADDGTLMDEQKLVELNEKRAQGDLGEER